MEEITFSLGLYSIFCLQVDNFNTTHTAVVILKQDTFTTQLVMSLNGCESLVKLYIPGLMVPGQAWCRATLPFLYRKRRSAAVVKWLQGWVLLPLVKSIWVAGAARVPAFWSRVDAVTWFVATRGLDWTILERERSCTSSSSAFKWGQGRELCLLQPSVAGSECKKMGDCDIYSPAGTCVH